MCSACLVLKARSEKAKAKRSTFVERARTCVDACLRTHSAAPGEDSGCLLTRCVFTRVERLCKQCARGSTPPRFVVATAHAHAVNRAAGEVVERMGALRVAQTQLPVVLTRLCCCIVGIERPALDLRGVQQLIVVRDASPLDLVCVRAQTRICVQERELSLRYLHDQRERESERAPPDHRKSVCVP